MEKIGINNTMNASFSNSNNNDISNDDQMNCNNALDNNTIINKQNCNHTQRNEKFGNTFILPKNNITNNKPAIDSDFDPIANSFYDLPINHIQQAHEINHDNQRGLSINNTMKDNYNCDNSIDEEDDLNESIDTIDYLFPNIKDIDEYATDISFESNFKMESNDNDNTDCDISYLFKINNQLNYSPNKPLWYILNETNYSSYGPISSIGILSLFRNKKINGRTKVKLLDVFQPIVKEHTFGPLRNISKPNYLIDYYTVNPQLIENITKVEFLSITNTTYQVNSNAKKKKHINMKTKGKELIIKHKYE